MLPIQNVRELCGCPSREKKEKVRLDIEIYAVIAILLAEITRLTFDKEDLKSNKGQGT